MENDEQIKNKKHIEKVYLEKASNLSKFCIYISIFSLLTYIYGIIRYNSFDFGFIFELISFVLIILASNKINSKNFELSKKYVILAMIPIGWLIIYDFINLLINIKEVLMEVFYYYTSFAQYFYFIEPYLFDVTLVANIILLFIIYKSLNKADGTEKNVNYTDTFYDEL